MSEGLCSKREPEVGSVAHVGRVERALLRLAAHGVLAQLVIRGQGALGVRVPVREHGGDVLPWQELDVLVLVVGVVLVLGVIEGGADAVGQIVIETPAVELVGVVVDVFGDVVDVVRVVAIGRNRASQESKRKYGSRSSNSPLRVCRSRSSRRELSSPSPQFVSQSASSSMVSNSSSVSPPL